MRVGYCVEGSADRALLHGLKRRWCPHAELVPGRFRGSTDQSLRREVRQVCRELDAKGCGVFVFLTDANGKSWRSEKKGMRALIPDAYVQQTIIGIPDRNVECWYCADPDWIAKQTGRNGSEFRSEDPKGAFNAALEASTYHRREDALARLVEMAPLKEWIGRSSSFADFYEQARIIAKQIDCSMPNERAG